MDDPRRVTRAPDVPAPENLAPELDLIREMADRIPESVRHVLTQPPDRVSYRMLEPGDEELQRIADMALEAGLLERRLDIKALVDRRFIPEDIKPAAIVVE